MAKPTDAADWTRWGSANVSDALRKVGRCFQAMDGGIRPIDIDMRTAGPVFTVRCYPGATWALERALELAEPGDVLVVDGGARPDVILMGGLMSTRAHARGIAGAVIDAAVRDTQDIVELGFPMFSRYIAPRAGTHCEIGEWQTTICCGRVPVTPGDWIVADRNGAVIVPRGDLEKTAAAAEEIWTFEEAMAPRLREGKDFKEAREAVEGGAHSASSIGSHAAAM